jgi:hypothetical protein
VGDKLNSFNQRSRSNVDKRFVASYVYMLPTGRGKKFGRGVGRAADLAIGGWEVTGIATFQTGFPFGIGANDIQGIQCTVAPRVNMVAGCDPTSHVSGQFARINMSCFTQPPPGTYGNTMRNFLRQPGINNFDMASPRTSTSLNGSTLSLTWTHSTPSTITSTPAT